MNKISTIQAWLSGDILRTDFIRKQYKLLALIVCLIFIYILSGYSSARQQRRMSDLKREVRDKKFEYLTISAELAERTKQSSVIQQLTSQGSKLRENTEPVIYIKP